MIHKIFSDQAFSISGLKRLLMLLVFLIASNFISAEDLATEELNPGNGEAEVPIDGGASFLLAAAAGLGAYRINRNNRLQHSRKHNSDTNGEGYPKTEL